MFDLMLLNMRSPSIYLAHHELERICIIIRVVITINISLLDPVPLEHYVCMTSG